MTSSVNIDGFLLTHRNYVYPWEQDENSHWSAQFFIRSFSQASATLGLIANGRECAAAQTSIQHTRFFGELRGSASLEVFSARIDGGSFDGRIVHVMNEAGSNRLCASSIDKLTFDVTAVSSVPEAQIRSLLPRGLEPEGDGPWDTTSAVESRQGLVSYLGVLQRSDFDHTGSLLPATVHAQLSSGAANLWNYIGVPLKTLHSKGLGPVVAETKGNFYRSAAEGDVVRLVSWFDRMEHKTLRMRHQLESLADGQPLATMSSIVLLLDQTSRRSIVLPDFVQAACAPLLKSAAVFPHT
ncbi:acyl-CoA thioesterase [Mesorhizobium sp. A556]